MCCEMSFKTIFLTVVTVVLGGYVFGVYQGWVPSPKSLIRAYVAKQVVSSVVSSVDLKKMLPIALPAANNKI